VPDTIGFLQKLIDLKLSENHLSALPSSIGSLKKLGTLALDKNRIRELPPEIGQIKTLVNLDLRENPITVLPAELGRLQYLRKLRLENCPLKKEFVHQVAHSPPSLMELAARTIVRQQIPILEDTTEDIKNYLASARKCTFCGGPYFESFVKRGKFLDKNEHHVPLEYRLCQPHWNTEQERVILLFCALPETAPSPEPYGHQHHPMVGAGGLQANCNSTGTMDGEKGVTATMRPSISRSMTVPVSSLTKTPTLPSLPGIATPTRSMSAIESTGTTQDDFDVMKNTPGNRGTWLLRKNSAATILMGKGRNGSTLRLPRWGL